MTSARESWNGEKQLAHLYRVLAEEEHGRTARQLFEKLAAAAEDQARETAARLDGEVPTFTPSARLRIVASLARRLGPRAIRPVLAAMKVRGLWVYDAPAPTPHPLPTSADVAGHRHQAARAGGNLRAAVFGVNDGLVSNACLILGVAGAQAEPQMVVLSGLAGLLAGSFSMAAGEWVSVRSQRELYEHQIAIEAAEIAEHPEEEAEELALTYEARGIELGEARALAKKLMADPARALETHAREELGVDPSQLGSPWGAAVSSLLSFTLGALVPLLPFLLGAGHAIGIAIALSSLSLFSIGCALSLFTGRSALWSGVRMLLIGGTAGALTWFIGSALGVGLA